MDFYLNHGVEYKEDISGIIFYFEKTIIFDSYKKLCMEFCENFLDAT